MPSTSSRTPRLVERCRSIVSSRVFEPAVLALILLNAVVLGLETFGSIADGHQRIFELVYAAILTAFILELLIRFAATGWNVREFLADKWNVFDFVVIAIVVVPGVRKTGMVLRLIRLVRIVRVIRFLPDLQIIVGAIVRSVRGIASLAAATALLLYIYGMLGWILFSHHDPENYGNIGHAMLTMFIMLTLENLPDNVAMGQEVSQWSILFFVSYVLMMSFLIFNLFIGIVLGAMEEARTAQAAEHETDDLPTRLRSARQALEEAERELARMRRTESQRSRRPMEPDLADD
jgi:voltage-gated sodium channel